jgi:hypothetical protein
MSVSVIIALVCSIVLGWFWLKKPVLKGAPARTWPAGRAKAGAKAKLS